MACSNPEFNKMGLKENIPFFLTPRVMLKPKQLPPTFPDWFAHNRRNTCRYVSGIPCACSARNNKSYSIRSNAFRRSRPANYPGHRFATNTFQNHHRIINAKTSSKTKLVSRLLVLQVRNQKIQQQPSRMALEVKGRWSAETAQFVRLLAQTRSRAVPPALRQATAQAYIARWSALPNPCSTNCLRQQPPFPRPGRRHQQGTLPSKHSVRHDQCGPGVVSPPPLVGPSLDLFVHTWDSPV